MSSIRVCFDHSERPDGPPHRKLKTLRLKLKLMNHSTWRSSCVGDRQAPVAGGTRNFLCYGRGGALMMPPRYRLEFDLCTRVAEDDQEGKPEEVTSMG